MSLEWSLIPFFTYLLDFSGYLQVPLCFRKDVISIVRFSSSIWFVFMDVPSNGSIEVCKVVLILDFVCDESDSGLESSGIRLVLKDMGLWPFCILAWSLKC